MTREPPAVWRVRSFETLAALAALALAAAIGGVVLLGKPGPLAVVAVTPADGAAGVPIATQVVVTFSRPVDEPSIRASLAVQPETRGLVSVAGRRAAFTPRGGFRADTEYTLTLGPGLRDRAGQSLSRQLTTRFRTRGQRLVVRTVDGRLLRLTLEGTTEWLAGPGVGAFAVSAAGDVAYVQPAEAMLVVQPGGPGPPARMGTRWGDDRVSRRDW
jgi:Bacterial Ig-like domain